MPAASTFPIRLYSYTGPVVSKSAPPLTPAPALQLHSSRPDEKKGPFLRRDRRENHTFRTCRRQPGARCPWPDPAAA